MDNKYLRDKARRRRRRMMDSRRGNRRTNRDYARDFARYDSSESYYMGDHRTDSRNMDSTYDRHYEHGGQYMYPAPYNVGHYLYAPDGKDYDESHEYHKELEEWVHNLKHFDRFGLPKEEVLKKAREMGVKFHEYDELEFYATYLMVMSDFKHVANDPHQYLAMAKEWLEDKDAKRQGSEKLCAYLYTIVLGEDDD